MHLMGFGKTENPKRDPKSGESAKEGAPLKKEFFIFYIQNTIPPKEKT